MNPTTRSMATSHKQDIKKLNELMSNPQSDSDQVKSWYLTSCPSAKKLSRNRIFDAMLGFGPEGIKAIKELELERELETDLNSIQCSILMIRYFIETDQLEKASTLFEALPTSRKRHAQLLMHAYIKVGDWNMANRLLGRIITDYPAPGVEEADILPFLNDQATISAAVFDMLVGHPVTVSQSNITISDSQAIQMGLTALDFTDSQLAQLMESLNQTFLDAGASAPKIDLSRHYDYIIDGANVLYHINGTITAASYQLLIRLIKSLGEAKVLLVLHARHFKSPLFKAVNWDIPGLELLKTPYPFNDDYYSLLNAFPRPKSLLITNDQFRDHIYKLSSSLVKCWRAEKVVEYQYSSDTLVLYKPLPYSFRVQKCNDYYYIPCQVIDTGSQWYRIKANQ